MRGTIGRVTRRRIAGYALGSVGTGGFGTLPGLVLAYYLTDTLGVAAGLAGLVVVLPKVWDVAVDPLVGSWSDRRRAATGTRRGTVVLGALTLPFAFALLFGVPAGLSGPAAALWVTVAFLLATTAFSLVQVPYVALPAELAPGYLERTRLMAPRIAVLAVAILAFGAGGPALRTAVAEVSDARTGYLVMAVVAGLVMCGGFLAVAAVTPRGRPEPHAAPGGTPGARAVHVGAVAAVRAAFRTLAEIPVLRALLATFVLQALATGAMLAAAQYVATYVLGDEGAVTFLFAALVAPAVLVMAPARRLADRVGKRRAFVAATVLFAVAALALLPVRWAPGAWVYVPVAVAGVAYAGLQMYPLAMLPDVMSTDARRGTDRSGAVAGVWTAGETAGLAVGPTLVLGLLAVTGFVSRAGGAVPVQPGTALTGVVVAFSVVPALLVALSLLPLARYRLEAADVDVVPGRASTGGAR